MELLEKKVSLGSCDHVILLALDQFTSLQLEELLVLLLSFFDVISQRLSFNTGSDHFLLISTQFFISQMARHAIILLFKVLGVLERGCSVEVGIESSLHVWKLPFHGGVPVILD